MFASFNNATIATLKGTLFAEKQIQRTLSKANQSHWKAQLRASSWDYTCGITTLGSGHRDFVFLRGFFFSPLFTILQLLVNFLSCFLLKTCIIFSTKKINSTKKTIQLNQKTQIT